ncbi:hypothetical protein F5146DRAFT_1066559 [Armillaria mellea]|nr:hypothetical protein F5146DRAFT_1066559 [Armillaria mellea]
MEIVCCSVASGFGRSCLVSLSVLVMLLVVLACVCIFSLPHNTNAPPQVRILSSRHTYLLFRFCLCLVLLPLLHSLIQFGNLGPIHAYTIPSTNIRLLVTNLFKVPHKSASTPHDVRKRAIKTVGAWSAL